MANNTTIKLKYSDVTAVPSSLANQEPAYTTNGHIFYIGTTADGIVAIGGRRFPGVLTANQAIVTNSTNMIDTIKFGNSTSNSVVNSSAFGLANSTVSYSLTLPTLAQQSGSYYAKADGTWALVAGGTTPSGSNTSIQFNDSGSFGGSAGITFDKTTNNVTVANSVTAARFAAGTTTANSTQVVVNGGTSINSTSISTTDITVSGNLVVSGTLATVDTTNLSVTDSIIKLARQNATNSLDIGFFGAYNDGAARFAGLVYDASSGRYELFANTTEEPTTTVNLAGTGYAIGTLRAYLASAGLVVNSSAVTVTANSTYAVNLTANTLALATALPATSGGTGTGTPLVGDLLIGGAGSTWVKTAINTTSGKILQSNGTTLVYGDIDGGTF